MISDILSNEMVIAVIIYENEVVKGNKNITLELIENKLKNSLSRSTILNALNELVQWGIIKSSFDELNSGRIGRTYLISGETISVIKAFSEQFWDKINEAIQSSIV